MPLIQESSEDTIHSNIKKLIGEGYKRKQAVAIAYSEAGKSNGKKDQLQEKPSRYKFSSAGRITAKRSSFHTLIKIKRFFLPPPLDIPLEHNAQNCVFLYRR